MTREEFEEFYKPHKPGLDRALAELKRLLSDGIDKLRDNISFGAAHKAGLFRIRLTEARVKEHDSLFAKIVEDGLDPKRAFEPRYVRDLLGARLVCHNLNDVAQLAEAFEQGQFGALHYLKPPGGEKNYLHNGDPKSGYRGWHVDVRWQVPTEQGYDHAEIQIRTLLQDA